MSNSIIVGFSTHKDFNILSWIIQKVEKTTFSHVYIRWYSATTDRQLTYQASGLAVNFCGQEVFYTKNVDIAQFSISITDAEKITILQTAIDLAGKPYGIMDLVGIGLVRLMALFGKKIKNLFRDEGNAYICSELVATILIKIGFKFEELSDVTPKDVYDKLRGIYGTNDKN
jgi:hypothetical protein